LVPLLSLPVLAALVWWRETWMYETVDISQVHPSPASRMANLQRASSASDCMPTRMNLKYCSAKKSVGI
ncbi:MAG: hypothetical protein WCA06_12620, partial [Terrimicrobiaceae bacterium]